MTWPACRQGTIVACASPTRQCGSPGSASCAPKWALAAWNGPCPAPVVGRAGCRAAALLVGTPGPSDGNCHRSANKSGLRDGGSSGNTPDRAGTRRRPTCVAGTGVLLKAGVYRHGRVVLAHGAEGCAGQQRRETLRLRVLRPLSIPPEGELYARPQTFSFSGLTIIAAPPGLRCAQENVRRRTRFRLQSKCGRGQPGCMLVFPGCEEVGPGQPRSEG